MFVDWMAGAGGRWAGRSEQVTFKQKKPPSSGAPAPGPQRELVPTAPPQDRDILGSRAALSSSLA